jgi:hypothetical protein
VAVTSMTGREGKALAGLRAEAQALLREGAAIRAASDEARRHARELVALAARARERAAALQLPRHREDPRD